MLVLGISQSGKSPDIVSVLAEARRQGALTAAITNSPESELGWAAEFVIALHAGLEKAVAATKTYTAELTAIALLATTLAGDPELSRALDRAPLLVQQALNMNSDLDCLAERYRYAPSCVTIGRGYNYCTAFELSLKLQEMTYIVAEAYSSADFLHGPVALITQGFPVIVVSPSCRMLGEMKKFIVTAKERGAEMVVISDDDEAINMGRVAGAAAGRPRVALAGQRHCARPTIGNAPGTRTRLDPDRPRALHKVTETK